MSRTSKLKVLLVALVGAFIALTFAFARSEKLESEPALTDVDHVVLFTVPHLGIDDVDPEVMPVLDRLAGRGAIAATNVRSKGDDPDTVDAYATLGAGNRVSIGDLEPPAVISPSPVEGEPLAPTTTSPIDPATGEPIGATPIAPTAGTVDAESLGGAPTDPDLIVVREMGEIISNADAGNDPGAQPGALADALRRAGMRAAVVTNADVLTSAPPAAVSAPAAVAAADRFGLIDRGSISYDLLQTDVSLPGSVAADPDRFAAAVGEASTDAQLVVVDPGETTRAATTAALLGDTPAAETLRLEALARTDAILGAVADELDPDTLLLVVGVTPPGSRWSLTPMVMTGAGTPRGYLHSSSTHRPDLVTLTDVAPTVLDALGVDPPGAMIGNPLAYRPGDADWAGALALDELLERRAPIDRPMAVGFIVVQTVVYLLAIAVLITDRPRPAWFDKSLLFVVVTCAAWPLATFWLRIAPSLYSYGAGTFVLCWVVAGVVAALVTRLRHHVLDPVLALCVLTAGTIVGDLATGAQLQYGSFFGYAPTTAPRFIGIGNAAFALLGGATVVICTALVARSRDRSLALWCGGAVAAVVVIADGAPWMGTDVGGILTLVPVLCLMFWALSGRQVRWHTIGLAVLAAAAVLGIAVLVESLRDPGQRTHIGRFFLESGDGTTVQDTFSRKWKANTAVLRRSPLAWAVPIIAGAGFVAVASGRFFRRVLPLGSPERTGVTATLAMGFVGWILNDSGVVVLALASVFLGPYILLLAQARSTPGSRVPPPSEPPASPDDVEPAGSVTAAMSVDAIQASPDPTDALVVAIVPAKDRADSVAATVRALLALDGVDQVLVVDDGSIDDTSAEAVGAGAEVLRLPRNLGKGGAVAEAVEATPEADVYLLIDADVGDYASEASALLRPVLEDRADLVIGVLPSPGSKGGFGNVRRFSRWGIRRACGLDTRAPLSGQRAVRAEHLRGLRASGRFGLEVAMTIDAVRGGARVIEVDVAMEHRHTGRSVSGFRHRGAQGLDIASALWPRVLSAPIRRGGLILCVAAFLLASFVTADAAEPDSSALVPGAGRVVLVGVPGLSLSDISGGEMPNLLALTDEGALGMATARTRGSLTPVAVYASIGAGDRVRAGGSASLAVGPDAPIEGDPAAVVVERRAGTSGEGSVVLPAIAAIIRDAGTQVDSLPGALGLALRGAERPTAVVANSTTVAEDGVQELSAPAALAVVDRKGSIDHGDVGNGLLRPAPLSPFGIEADPDAFSAAVAAAVERSDVTVVDPGEMDRFLAYRPHLADDIVPAVRAGALSRTDSIIGAIEGSLPDDALLIVTGITPGPGGKLVPIVFSGQGISGGGITSASTRRADLVAVTDIAPTILRALGEPVPDEMIGRPVRFTGGDPSWASLQEMEDLIIDRDEVYSGLHRTFVVATIAFYAAAAFLLLRSPAPGRFRRWLELAALTTMAWPIAGFIARAVPATYGWGWGSHVFVWGLSAAIAWASVRIGRRPMDPLLAVGALSTAVIVLDLATGANLQESSYLGYTPSVAARFVGLGNAAFGVLAGATILTCALIVARSDRPADAWWLAAAIGTVAVVADGAPWLGADVGGILSFVPALCVTLLLLAGRRLTWKVVFTIAVAAVVVLGLAIGWEASREPDQRTHIGRFFLGDGGFGSTIARKWEVNLRLLTNSRWSWLIPGLGGFVLAVLAFGDRWRQLLGRRPAEAAGVVGLVVVAVLGWATNDSGPLVAALVLVYLAPLVLFVALRGPVEDPVRLSPSLVASHDGAPVTAR